MKKDTIIKYHLKTGKIIFHPSSSKKIIRTSEKRMYLRFVLNKQADVFKLNDCKKQCDIPSATTVRFMPPIHRATINTIVDLLHYISSHLRVSLFFFIIIIIFFVIFNRDSRKLSDRENSLRLPRYFFHLNAK